MIPAQSSYPNLSLTVRAQRGEGTVQLSIQRPSPPFLLDNGLVFQQIFHSNDFDGIWGNDAALRLLGEKFGVGWDIVGEITTVVWEDG